jgi:hypothetical protein
VKKLLISSPLLLIAGILCVVFAFLALTTKPMTEHRLTFFDEEVLLQLTGATRVDVICQGAKFDYASTWNDSFNTGSELNFSDLVQKNYPEPLLNRLDEECSNNFVSRTTDRLAYGALAVLMAGYFVWGFKQVMNAE